MNSDELKLRTKKFSRRCLKLCRNLPKDVPGNYIANQLTRASLSIASNYRAACIAQSQAAFAAKISIVLEEADESLFWIETIEEELLLPGNLLVEIKQESYELTRIFLASRATAQKKKRKKVVIAD